MLLCIQEYSGIRKKESLWSTNEIGHQQNSEVEKGNENALITVLFATESNPQFCALLKTAILNEQNVHVVGWNLEHSGKGKVTYNGRSIDAVKVTPRVVSSYICTLEKNTILLGADAFDTLFSAHSKPRDLLDSFQTLQAKFIWSAESNMWPSFSSLPSSVEKFYRARKSRRHFYRFLNYGGWIGTAETACSTLKLSAEQLERCRLCHCNGSKDCKFPKQDQGAAHVVFAARKRSRSMVLDYNQRIFHPAYPSCKNLRVSGSGDVHVENISTSTHMYHFNGASKYHSGCKDHYKYGWFTNVRKPETKDDMVVFIGNKNEQHSISATKVCPYIWLQNFTWAEPKKKGRDTKWQISIREKVLSSS